MSCVLFRKQFSGLREIVVGNLFIGEPKQAGKGGRGWGGMVLARRLCTLCINKCGIPRGVKIRDASEISQTHGYAFNTT